MATEAHRWRAKAMILLALLVAQTWLVVDTALELGEQRRINAELGDPGQERRYLARIHFANRRFKNCLAANEGLVEVLREFDQTVKDQQALIDDAVAVAKRCDMQPSSWVVLPPQEKVYDR